MRTKSLVTAVLAVTLVFLLAAPAFAQRDPFRPLVTEEAPAPATVTVPVEGAPAPAPAPAPAVPEAPRTGIEALNLVALGLMLILFGIGFLALDRYRQFA